MNDYAQAMMVNLPPAIRVETYLDTNGDRLLKTVTQFGANVRYALGFQQIDTDMPVMAGSFRFV